MPADPEMLTEIAQKRLGIQIDLTDLGLTHPQLNFIIALYQVGFDHPEKAVAKAKIKFSSEAQARRIGMHLMSITSVSTAINRILDAKLGPIRERIEYQYIEALMRRAFWNPKEIFESNGNVKELNKIEYEFLTLIDGITVDYRGKDADQKVVNYKLASRSEALKLLNDWRKEKAVNGDGKETSPDEVKNRITAMRDKMDELKREGRTGIRKTKLRRRVVEEEIETEDDDQTETSISKPE